MDLKLYIAFGMSLLVTLFVLPKIFIPYLHKIKFGQVEREEGLESHKKKGGTPTMGGIVFVLVPILVCLFLNYEMFVKVEVLVVVLAYVGYACIGFIDDFIIVVKKNNEGLKPKHKLFLQLVLAVVFYLIYINVADTTLFIPLLNMNIDLGILYFGFVLIMFMGESNAVNFTDGLDGLLAGLMYIALLPFLYFTYQSGNFDITMLIAAVLGSLLGYLRFNKHPAKIFMGDTGSLALGGFIAAIAMVEKKELLLLVIGGVFLIEMLSVVIQVLVYKKTKKRVFKMAPIHHHFEMCGMSETKVVKLFYAAGIILACIGLWMGVM